MTFTIPVWVLVTLGIVVGVPLVLIVLAFAAFGFVAARALKGGIYK